MKKIASIQLLIATGLVLTSSSVFAAQSFSKVDAKMSIPVMCSIASVSNVDFGAYTGAANKDATMNVGIRCTRTNSGLPIKVLMDCGQNGTLSGNVCARKLKNTAASTAVLDYKIYSNSSYATELTSEGFSTSYSGGGANVSFPFYPRLPLGQYTARYGDYSDEVTVSVSF